MMNAKEWNVLSTGERILLGVAWTVWSGGETDIPVPFSDVFYRMDDRLLKAVGSLLVASAEGSDALTEWRSVWQK